MNNATKLNKITIDDIISELVKNGVGFNTKTTQNYRVVNSGSSIFTPTKNGIKYFLSSNDRVNANNDFIKSTNFILKTGVSYDIKKNRYVGSNDTRIGCGYITTVKQFNEFIELLKLNSVNII